MRKERYSSTKLHEDIKQKTPKEIREHLESLVKMYKHWQNYEGQNYTMDVFEYGVYEEVQKMLAEVMADTSIRYNHDMNYYYNPENIPNQEAVFATWDFLEHTKNGLFEPLQFFNLLFKQIDLLKDSIDKPFDYLQSIKELPYSEEQLHLLFGMILYWHGGNVDLYHNPKYKTILKLIEKEFLSMYPDTLTHEKRFCLAVTEQQKKMAEAELIINQQVPKTYSIPHSKYLKRMDIDFEGLPTYVVEKGIIAFYEDKKMYNDGEYTEWQQSLLRFLPTIPEEYILKTVQKGIEYGKKAYAIHLEFECATKDNCAFNESWERRISMNEHLLKKIIEGTAEKQIEPEIETEHPIIEEAPRNKDFTMARQVLALHYLLQHCDVSGVDNTIKARFIQFITGRETGASNIKNTAIYKRIGNPLGKGDKNLIADLQYIRQHFEALGAMDIAKAIQKEITAKTK